MNSSVLRGQTIAAIGRLKGNPWFKNVGKSDMPADRVVQLSSWAEALDVKLSDEWQDIRLEMLNQFHENVLARRSPRYSEIPAVLESLKAANQRVVAEACRDLVVENGLPVEFVESVLDDMVLANLELEFSDVVEPVFFLGLGFFYSRGHVPCGWKGALPARAGQMPTGLHVIY